jgi:hypothetical protein
MPENKTLDPFKPAQPRIPGVADHAEVTRQPSAEPRVEVGAAGVNAPPANEPPLSVEKLKFVWTGITLAVALGTIFFFAGHSRKAAPVDSATNLEQVATPAEPVSAAPQPDVSGANRNWPVGPGLVATAAQLAKPWSAKLFYFRDQLTQRQTPAMVVRLPGGALWAFSMREPYGTCDLEYVTNLQKLQRDYDFSANHPMVADPCNKSVFDLTRYGTAPGGLVRGEVVKGSAFRPPMAIEVRSEKNQIIAVRTEQ